MTLESLPRTAGERIYLSIKHIQIQRQHPKFLPRGVELLDGLKPGYDGINRGITETS